MAFGPEDSGIGLVPIAMSTSGSISNVGSTESMGWEEVEGINGSSVDEAKLGSAMLKVAKIVTELMISD